MEKKEKNSQKPVEYPEPKNEIQKVNEPVLSYRGKQYSYADYLKWTEDKMYEIINGMVYALSAPVRKHARIVVLLLRRLLPFVGRRKGKCEIYTAPFDVRLPKNGETADDKIYNVVQPDICVICDSSKLDEKGCIGAPDLVVEVISPSTGKKDMNEKFFLYEYSGVREYWVVFPLDSAVTVFLLQANGKYDDGTTYELVKGQTKVPVNILEGLIIDLNELFEE